MFKYFLGETGLMGDKHTFDLEHSSPSGRSDFGALSPCGPFHEHLHFHLWVLVAVAHSINSFYSAPVPWDQLASEPPAVLASPGQRWDLGYHAGAKVYYWSLWKGTGMWRNFRTFGCAVCWGQWSHGTPPAPPCDLGSVRRPGRLTGKMCWIEGRARGKGMHLQKEELHF